MSNPLKPSAQLLCKLGSIIVHADEAQSSTGHQFDKIAFQNLMDDIEVKAWIRDMAAQGFLPVKRNRS